MPRTKRPNPADSPIRDVPRAGFTCGSYFDGHNVHYIPALKLSADRESVAARLTWENAGLRLSVRQENTIVHNHNPAGIRLLLDELGTKCLWFPDLRLACWPGASARDWVSLALKGLASCTSTEQSRLEEAELWA
jgi:hypothetical protein